MWSARSINTSFHRLYLPPATTKMSSGAIIQIFPAATTKVSPDAITKMSFQGLPPKWQFWISLERCTLSNHLYMYTNCYWDSHTWICYLRTSIKHANLILLDCHVWFCEIFSGSETLAINKSVASTENNDVVPLASPLFCMSLGWCSACGRHTWWMRSWQQVSTQLLLVPRDMVRTFVSIVNSIFLIFIKDQDKQTRSGFFSIKGIWWAIDFEERKDTTFVNLFN